LIKNTRIPKGGSVRDSREKKKNNFFLPRSSGRGKGKKEKEKKWP